MIYLAKKTQIVLLVSKKIWILTKYLDFSNIFLEKKALILPKATKINQHAIKFPKNQQPPYRSIYSLKPVELKTLKTYTKTNLANNFIWLSKLPTATFIYFFQKPDGILCLYVDYWGSNNLMIKNQYLLPLISKSLDQLGQKKRFIQLKLTNVY